LYAMGALAGDPRANVHYMEPHEEKVARRANSFVSGQEYSCAVCAWIVFVKVLCTMIYALATCSSCQAPFSSRSLNRSTYTPKVSSTRLPKALLYPLHFPLQFFPLALVILDALSTCWFREFRKRILDWDQG
jgi:hypothetical protein